MVQKRPASVAGVQRAALIVAVASALALLLLGCAAAGNPEAGQGADDAGFWLGLWHGIIAPIAFVVSLFNDGVGIYEIHNTGGWYDFGFLFGVSVAFSGGGAGAAGRSRSSKATQ